MTTTAARYATAIGRRIRRRGGEPVRDEGVLAFDRGGDEGDGGDAHLLEDLGGEFEVPTIDGRAQLKIPPGTQAGQKLRLREKGVPSASVEGKRGDQIVEVLIVVPKLQDERSKEILRELAKLYPENPRERLFAEV